MLNTTHGLLAESDLARTVIFEDRPREFVVAVEWRLPTFAGHDPKACPVCAQETTPQPAADGTVLVRRDAWVNLKEASVEARAVASAIGG